MKRLIVLTSLLFTSPLFAFTYAPAVIKGDVEWDRSGSPYLIQGKAVVPKGSSLKVDAAVQVIFQGAAALEVQGSLEASGSSAGPAVFNMSQGGLNSEIFINGGEARLTNVKLISGVFLARDANLTMEGNDITKGSGVYLQGATTARLKNNKIYGNATGVVTDGKVTAFLRFNTIVQNTYGLYLKKFSAFDFRNNSIHDNQKEVVNGASKVDLGGNSWGTGDEASVKAKVQGPVALSPMRTLKDVLRVFVRTQLPVITKQQADALVAREKREEKEQALALAKFRKQQKKEGVSISAPASAPAPATAEVPAPSSATAPANPPEVTMPGAAPSLPTAENNTASESSPQVPPEVADTSSAPPSFEAPPGLASTSPSSSDSTIPPPPPANSTTSSQTTASATTESIPSPPDLGEQIPASGAPPVPQPPATASLENSSAPSSAIPPAPAVSTPEPLLPPTRNMEPTEDEQKAMKKLEPVTGDIDGMQAPPLDLGPVLSATPPSEDAWSGKKTDKDSLALPPLKESEVIPPKDLDLPPIDDLGNINLDSRNR